MSRIGRKPIDILEGATVSINHNIVDVKGPKGEQSFNVQNGIEVKVADGKVIVSSKEQEAAPLYGLTRAIIANMITGVTKGFEKKLELVGVGFRAAVAGDELTLSLGFSHPVKMKAPIGITFSVSEGKSQGSIVTVTGIDKHLVGQVAATMRGFRPPEPYKGKGIRYLGERIRKKAGKAAKAVGTTTK